MPAYIQRVLSDVCLARPMRIAINAGNGVAGPVAAKLFKSLGCDVMELYTDVDGNFPNHLPIRPSLRIWKTSRKPSVKRE